MANSNSDTNKNIRVNYYKDEVYAYDKMEHWGLTLIMSGIGATTYKLVEWVSCINKGCLSRSPDLIIYGPLIIGIIGMWYLYTTNWRCRRSKIYLKQARKEDPNAESRYDELPKNLGMLGRIIGWMPLLAGFGSTLLVGWSRFPYNNNYWIIKILLMIVLTIFIAELIYHSTFWYFVHRQSQIKPNNLKHSP